ncbi:MAG: SUMF1/EgtB/PvdO family nonheme iron enzyme, partial [Nitrospinae bacterium]|nr:SUMF1/EgtB/PvdO family nonheme iron enzyme [Nitrospinota bacterium]
MNEISEMKRGKDEAAMVYVPAGPFLMGSETGNADERPQREVTLDAFWIDKYCVTNTQYRAFLEETEAFPPPPSFARDDFVGPEQPIVSISWEEANAYARWVGKRLPTEAEWEKASRGTDGHKYPWGEDEPSPERAVYASTETDIHCPSNVDEFAESASPYNCVQMAGNVFEWVSDWFDGFYYQTGPAENPQGLEKPTFEVAMARVPVF